MKHLLIEREDFIHFTIRRYLKRNNWLLIAGQYPDGSDDELPTLNIVDPVFSKDDSPAPRKHSLNKIVPDLIAYKSPFIIIVEMKPEYSQADEKKLEHLLIKRRSDFLNALSKFINLRKIDIKEPLDSIHYIPCLGFSINSKTPKINPYFAYFRVQDQRTIVFEGNKILPVI